MKKAIMHRIIGLIGMRNLSRFFRPSGVLVLNYHRVGNGNISAFDRGLWSADADAFAEQVAYCKINTDIISPADLPYVLSRAQQGRYTLITFDDGYRDNYEVAFPILNKLAVPATFFISTGFIDNPRLPWWDEIAWMVRKSNWAKLEMPDWLDVPVTFDEPDREIAVRILLQTYKSLSEDAVNKFLAAVANATGSGRCDTAEGNNLWMTWDMLREMRKSGMTIGGHTVNHPVLAKCSDERQEFEIIEAARRIVAETEEPMLYFSYPVGGPGSFNEFTLDCLKKNGIQYAFSYYGGFSRFSDWDSYDIKRVPIENYLTADWFESIVVMPQWVA